MTMPPEPELAANDDPRFAQWIADVGPMQDMPPEVPRRVMAVAVVVLIGASVVTVGLGWAALGYALQMDLWSAGAFVAMITGTLLVITGISAACYGHWRRRR